MSRLHLHRWAVIFLLVSKLILGQVAHGMPHMAPADDIPASVGHSSQPCGDHADESTDESCCEAGKCACPCLHSPAVAAVVLFTSQSSSADRVADPVEGAAWHRLSALFRPPA